MVFRIIILLCGLIMVQSLNVGRRGTTSDNWQSPQNYYSYCEECFARLEEQNNQIMQFDKILADTKANLTREFHASLIEKISASINEQNSLWLKCVPVETGKQCDITPGCVSKNGACFPINV